MQNYVVGKTIAGTTDSPTELSYNPAPKEAEIQFILSEIKHYLSADVDGESYWTVILTTYLETVNDAYTARKLYADDVFYSDPLVSDWLLFALENS